LFNPNTPLQPGQSSASLGRLPSDLTGLMFLQNPEGGPLFDMPAVPETTAEAESTDPSRDASGSASVPHTPSSHRSHHSRHSLSSTDVDSDVSYFTDGSVSSPSRAGITDLGSLGIGGLDLSQPPTPSATISPTAEGLGRRPKRTRKSEEVEDTPSPGPSNASEEPLQAVDEETRRQQRLEREWNHSEL
jgi:hypothetical protein